MFSLGEKANTSPINNVRGPEPPLAEDSGCNTGMTSSQPKVTVAAVVVESGDTSGLGEKATPPPKIYRLTSNQKS